MTVRPDPAVPESVFEAALQLAKEAAEAGEVPVGALVLMPQEGGWKIVGSDRNRILERKDPSAHAELLALQSAAKAGGSERLPGAILVTTLEPCVMCAGALILARIQKVMYFAPTEGGPGMRDLLAASRGFPEPFNHYPEMEEIAEYRNVTANLLRSFFSARRRSF